MRTQEFFIRTGIFLPITVFVILFVLMLVGLSVDMLGAKSLFYLSGYWKTCMAILGAGAIAILICQVKACWKNDQGEVRKS